jgi:hypothetical protein
MLGLADRAKLSEGVGRWTIGSVNPTLLSTALTDMSILAKRVCLRS